MERVFWRLVPSRDVGWNKREETSKFVTVGVASTVVASQTVAVDVATFVVDDAVRPWVSMNV